MCGCRARRSAISSAVARCNSYFAAIGHSKSISNSLMFPLYTPRHAYTLTIASECKQALYDDCSKRDSLQSNSRLQGEGEMGKVNCTPKPSMLRAIQNQSWYVAGALAELVDNS